MKSAYELAMERLDKEQGASKKLSEGQKTAIAEVESRLKARLAELDIFFAQKVGALGDPQERQSLQEEKTREIARAKDRAEEEKQVIRAD
ncbi:MAG: hypothetical protein PHP44_12350 [Kiritimatiellae bacterium]|nr:hypothetical protein [Kiritimatiellia bacterium]